MGCCKNSSPARTAPTAPKIVCSLEGTDLSDINAKLKALGLTADDVINVSFMPVPSTGDETLLSWGWRAIYRGPDPNWTEQLEQSESDDAALRRRYCIERRISVRIHARDCYPILLDDADDSVQAFWVWYTTRLHRPEGFPTVQEAYDHVYACLLEYYHSGPGKEVTP